MTHNIISLVGMMGSGKTAVASLLTEKLKYKFYDSDQYIEKQTALAITEIFSQYGEAYFRILEKKAIDGILSRKENTVISCGGGSFMQEHIRDNLLKYSQVFWLNTSAIEIYNRIKTDNSRPLLANNNSVAKISEILSQRIKYYKLAQYHINTDGKSPEEISQEIINKLKI